MPCTKPCPRGPRGRRRRPGPHAPIRVRQSVAAPHIMMNNINNVLYLTEHITYLNITTGQGYDLSLTPVLTQVLTQVLTYVLTRS